MKRSVRRTLALLALVAAGTGPAAAQAPDTPALLAAQRQAMQALAPLDGVWRGTARLFVPDGKTRELVQTERVGPMLGGSIKVVEGRGYGSDGSLEFNAFAVISYAPASGKYSFNSWAQGMKGDFNFEPRPDGFVWSMNFGRVSMRHTAVIQGDTWNEVGERLMEGQPPVRTVEMTLRRVGSTDWPAAGAVAPR
ncbi:MAG: DUF1579 domain-containing protein [Rubrivivax sp.]|nr:DUF1579 domain-containing protein [Rubrivivax sp.]